MPIKDNLYAWLVQNIVIPRMEILDKPGFIVSQFTEGKEQVYLREIFFPELLLANIETKIVEKYGEKGKHALYSAGKKFGYRYALTSKFPKAANVSEKEFISFCYKLVRFVESMYAKGIKHEIDMKSRTLTLQMKDYMSCRLNGLGFFLADGSISGIWAYMLSDNSIEGTHINCQGRGSEQCDVICGPIDLLKDKYKAYLTETDMSSLELTPEYKTINQIRPANFSKNSCRTLLDANVLKYNQGIISFKGDRYVLNESCSMYLLERELKKLPGADEIIYQEAFKYFKTMGEREKDQKFISDFFPALGWGDILQTTKNGKPVAYSTYFPWTRFTKDVNFAMYRGMMSGLVSGIRNETINFTKFEQSMAQCYMTLNLST